MSHPGGDTSAQYLTVQQILFWVRRHCSHCQFMCVDPAIEDSSPDAQALVNGSFGEPVIWDAALMSPAHCLLAVWSSFFTVRDVPNHITGISLADTLHPDHSPRLALSTDRPPLAPCNVAGLPMQRYVTAARQHERHPSIRDGPGQVHVRGTERTSARTPRSSKPSWDWRRLTPWLWSSATWPATRLTPSGGGCSTTQ